MDRDFHTFQARFDAILPTLATKADMEALRADVARWTLATVIGLFVGFAGLFVAISNMLRPVIPATTPIVQSAVPETPGVPGTAASVRERPSERGQIAFIIINPAAEPRSAPSRK
ncbi:hypothetical protein [Massilia sp. NR 4-1]|uniref:hypothetical protein n=1 Tax=Massilia sp. NR 4-1 TaxID=1678028 RepID=UPI00067BAEF0|nr:hypothetical protein [Massilia sp. NR 4-1]AKU24495.1 hypothetical protein ACZ75_26555 [Massilia sp. NR 4-1]